MTRKEIQKRKKEMIKGYLYSFLEASDENVNDVFETIVEIWAYKNAPLADWQKEAIYNLCQANLQTEK